MASKRPHEGDGDGSKETRKRRLAASFDESTVKHTDESGDGNKMDITASRILSAPRQVPEGAIRTSRPPSTDSLAAERQQKRHDEKDKTQRAEGKKPAEPLTYEVKQFLARKIGTHGHVPASLQDLSTTTHFDVVVNSARDLAELIQDPHIPGNIKQTKAYAKCVQTKAAAVTAGDEGDIEDNEDSEKEPETTDEILLMPPPTQMMRSTCPRSSTQVEGGAELAQPTAGSDQAQTEGDTAGSGRPQPEGATGSSVIAQVQPTTMCTAQVQVEMETSADPQVAAVAVDTPGVPQQEPIKGAAGGEAVSKGVDKEIQTDPLYHQPKEMTSSDDPELAVKDEYQTSAKRASLERKKLYKEKVKKNDEIYKEGLQMLNQLKKMMEVFCINKDPSVIDDMQEMWRKQRRKHDHEGNQ